MFPRPLLVLVVAAVEVPSVADAWQVHVGPGYDEDAALAVAFDAKRDVVAAGVTLVGGDTGSATVVKLARNGRLLWKTLVAGDGSASQTVAVDAAGDVVVGGLEGGIDESYRGHFTVTKLAGATGAVLWRHAEPESADGVAHVDAAGDVVLSARTESVFDEGTFTCAKLAGGDGAERWRVADCGRIVAGDAAGDVVVTRSATTRKLRGATGAVVWEQTALTVTPRFGALDGAGDVLLVTASTLLELDGTTGALHWQVVDPTLLGPAAGILALAVDPVGDVLLAGASALVPAIGNDFLVVKRSGSDGGERWRRTFTGDVPAIEMARAVAVDRRGDVTATGDVRDARGFPQCLVVRLDGRSGKTRWIRGLRGIAGKCFAVALDPIGNFALGGGFDPPDAQLFATSAKFVVARGVGWSGQGLRPVRVFR